MAYKQIMGKGPAMKTGEGIPKELMSGPAMYEAGHEGTDPKGKTTVTRQKTTQDGVSGTLLTATTVTPGSGGDSLSGNIIRTPEGDAAYAALTQAGKDAQDAKFKALNPRKEGSTNTSTRFTPDAPPPTKPMGYIPGKANIKAEGITPLTKGPEPMYAIQSSQGGGVSNPGNIRGVSGFNPTSPGGSPNDMVRTGLYERSGGKAEAAKHHDWVDAHNNSLTNRYSSEAVTKEFTERNGPVKNERQQALLSKKIAKGKERMDSNWATINVREISLSEGIKMKEKNKAGLRKYGINYTGQE